MPWVVPVNGDDARAYERTPDGITGAYMHKAMARTAQAGAKPACASAFARAAQVQKKERTAKHASSRCDPRLYSRCARQCCRLAGIVRRRLLRCCCCYRWASSYISIGVGGGGSIRATIPYQSTVRGTCAPLPLWTDCLLEPRPRCTATSVAHTLTPRRARCCEMSSYRGTSVAPPCDHRNIPAHTLIPRPSTTPPRC